MALKYCEFQYPISSDLLPRILAGLTMGSDSESGRFAEHNHYHVCTLYLDTADLYLYGQTKHESVDRYALRMRAYESPPQSPWFLEVKAREADTLQKKRTAISNAGGLRILHGEHPPASVLFDATDDDLEVLDAFCQLMETVDAAGIAYVLFERDAFVMPDRYTKVSLDRKLRAAHFNPDEGLKIPSPIQCVPFTNIECIMEVKFAGQMPEWMTAVKQDYGLVREHLSKYAMGIETLGLAKPSL